LQGPLVAMGASTGGPPVLQMILSQLPKDFAAPIVIVQHISPGFMGGFIDWLNETTGLSVHVAAHGMPLENSRVYVAPDDFHLTVNGRRAALSREPPENGVRPAVSQLFRSLVPLATPSTIGVLLTGMGKDGAAELLQLRARGAWTIAQDRESSVVHGMPGEAIQLGAAAQVLPAARIANALAIRVGRRAALAGEPDT
jgi:two-component system chemotaxis response regulator CheB